MLVQYLHPHGAQERVNTAFGSFTPATPVHVVDPDVAAALQRNVCFHVVDKCECASCTAIRAARPLHFPSCRCEACTAVRAAIQAEADAAIEAAAKPASTEEASTPDDGTDDKTRPGRKKARE